MAQKYRNKHARVVLFAAAVLGLAIGFTWTATVLVIKPPAARLEKP